MSSSRAEELRALLEDERRFRERVVASRIETAELATSSGQAAALAYTLLGGVVLAAAVLAVRDPLSVQAAVDALVIVVASSGVFALHAHRRQQRDRARVVTARPSIGQCRRCGPGVAFKLEEPIACERCGEVAPDDAVARMMAEARAARATSISQVLDLARAVQETPLTQQGGVAAGAIATSREPLDTATATLHRYRTLLGLNFVVSAPRGQVIDWLEQIWREPPPESLSIDDILGASRNVAIGNVGGRPIMIVETSRYETLDILLSIANESAPTQRSEIFLFMCGANRGGVEVPPPYWTVHPARPGAVLHRSCELEKDGSDPRRDEDVLAACRALGERSDHQ